MDATHETKSDQKKTITKAQHLQLVGLLALAKRHNERLDDIRRAVAEIIREEDDHGHASDIVYGDRDLDDGLRILGITVAE